MKNPIQTKQIAPTRAIVKYVFIESIIRIVCYACKDTIKVQCVPDFYTYNSYLPTILFLSILTSYCRLNNNDAKTGKVF